jgi:hypothetical protein
MAFTLDNFVRSVLAEDAAASDTSLVLTLAAPPLQDPPDATADAPGILVLQDSASAPTKIEIVTYTGRSISGTKATLTGVTRAQEGTSAETWATGTPTFSGTTAAVLAGKADLDGADFTKGPTINGSPIPGVTVTDTVPADVGSAENGHLWLIT